MNAVINMPACPMLLRTVRVNGHDVPLRVFGKMANGGFDDHTCVNVRFIPLMKDGSLDKATEAIMKKYAISDKAEFISICKMLERKMCVGQCLKCVGKRQQSTEQAQDAHGLSSSEDPAASSTEENGLLATSSLITVWADFAALSSDDDKASARITRRRKKKAEKAQPEAEHAFPYEVEGQMTLFDFLQG